MKYLVAVTLLFICGCSSPNNSPYHSEIYCSPPPGWVDIVKPGTFMGVWTLGSSIDSCSCTILSADSLFTGSITNTTTKEVLAIIPDGPFVITWIAATPCGYRYFHDYSVRDSSNLYGKIDFARNGDCLLSYDTDTLYYSSFRGDSILSIIAVRE